MAQAAVLREACRDVIRIGRAVEICQMARYTRGRESVKHVVFVALLTSDIDVGAGQREGRIAVIERRALPSRACVTNAAVLRETCRYVVWIGRAVEIRQMARDASSRESGEHVVFVTLGTRCDADVSSGQRKLRPCRVIERRALPIRR